MEHWRSWSQGEHPKVFSFIAFSDIEPSRYSLSYIQEPNPLAYRVKVAFIAVDSENLGEVVNDMYHTDFGDNQFPYYKGNTNVKIDLDKFKNEEDSGSDSSSDGDSDENDGPITPPQINKLVPPSILEYLSVNIAV